MTNSKNCFVFMKIGDHANENLSSVLERKLKEVEEEGVLLWGYGGSVCHPIKQVRPFVLDALSKGEEAVYAFMGRTKVHACLDTKFDSRQPVSDEFSIDGVTWEKIPEANKVTGSKYALVLGPIEPVNFEVHLEEYVVGVGLSEGKAAVEYLYGRNDKACLRRKGTEEKIEGYKVLKINYAAKLIEPYAVLVRGERS